MRKSDFGKPQMIEPGTKSNAFGFATDFGSQDF